MKYLLSFLKLLLDEIKEAKKGIPHQFKLELAEFKEVLYGEDFKHKVQVKSLRLDRDKRMCRTTLQKSGLTDIHVKMRVEWDRVTCEPLEKDGQFV